MQLDGAFTALLLLVCGFSTDAVPPPSNLTVECQNLQTTIRWDYSKDQPETFFRVKITGAKSGRSFEANTTDHQYDLSHFVWESKEHYLDTVYVFVTAVQGGKQSEPERSKSFSFNRLGSPDITCVLDFPPVKVESSESGAIVMFHNPLHFYEQLNRTVRRDESVYLQYTVSSSAGSKFKGKCKVTDLTCKLHVTFPDNVEECVTLKGTLLFHPSGSDEVPLRDTEKICSKGGVHMEMFLAVILGSIFLFVVILVVVIISKWEAWTMDIPTPHIQPHQRKDDERQPCVIPKPEETCAVFIFLPDKGSDSDNDDCSEQPKTSDGSSDDSPAKESDEKRECSKWKDADYKREGLMSGAIGTDEDSSADSMRTESSSLSSAEDEKYPYDCPHFVQRDLGDGELVTGYSGNENGL